MNSACKLFFLLPFIFFQSLLSNAQSATQTYSNNKEANAYFISALHYIEIGTPRTGGSPDSLKIAVELLEKAIKEDSLFALAYLELSRTWWRFGYSYPNYRLYFPGAIAVLPKSKKAILKALEIDSSSGEAYADLASLNLNYEYKWDEALKNLDKAIKYAPDNYENLVRYGQILALKGNWEAAQKWIDKAYSLAPNDSRVLLTISMYYNWKRDYKKADYYFNQINPPNYLSKFFQSMNYIADGNASKAIEILRARFIEFEKSTNDGGSKALMAYALTQNGELKEAEEFIKRSHELNQVVKYREAVFYVGKKDYKKAIELLEEYYGEHGNWMIWLKYDPALDPLRNEKRFIALLNKMKFE